MPASGPARARKTAPLQASAVLSPTRNQFAFAFWTLLVSLLVTIVVGLPSWESRISISVDDEELHNFSPLPPDDQRGQQIPKFFAITNSGPLTLTSVLIGCTFPKLDLPDGTSITNLGQTGFPNHSVDKLVPQETVTVECPAPTQFVFIPNWQPNKVAYVVEIRYRSEWSLFRSSRGQQFVCRGPYRTAEPLYAK
jgi:hypothetical protein